MNILITGATGGLGRVLGHTLQNAGHTVYGTCRDPDTVADAPAFPLLALDATDDVSVNHCIDELLSRESRIDAVVNCVNRMIIGAVEETPVDEVQALYDVNVFGVMRICRAVIPHMKAQGSGTVINMSSLGGLLAVPLMSSYTSAKFALEAFSEALYHELKPHGVSVVIMQPVAMHMERPTLGHHLELASGVTEASASHRMVQRMAADTEASKLTPEAVSQRISDIVVSDHKPLRVPMDRARAVTVLKRFAPQRVLHGLVNGLAD